jgi:hypothetical protein
MYMNAERYRIADKYLRSNQEQMLAVSLAGPALILSAFASELYLKCLLNVETGKRAHGHHLRKLFYQLSRASREDIETRWNSYTATPLRQRTYNAILALTGQDIQQDLDWTLVQGSEAFTELRYMHESDDLKTKFFLGDFPDILRDRILVLKPEWRNMRHGGMEAIPGFEDPQP